jgi:hypothetical protein
MFFTLKILKKALLGDMKLWSSRHYRHRRRRYRRYRRYVRSRFNGKKKVLKKERRSEERVGSKMWILIVF